MKDYEIKISNEQEDLSSLSATVPKIISFYAEKGGVGKTTLSLSLAHLLADKGKRVLIYDCDV